MKSKNSLLLELPLKFLKSDKDILVEAQAFNGLHKWLENFDYITVCAPVITSQDSSSSIVWKPLSELPESDRIVFVPLPVGYAVRDFIKHYSDVKRKFRNLIPKHDYLLFSNIGTIGSWGNLAVDVAYDLDRKYALWFDWVIHDMIDVSSSRGIKKLKAYFDVFYSKYKTFSAIRKSSLGLFHGKSVFNAYEQYCKYPHLVHDIHLTTDDAISLADLKLKLNETHHKKKLKVGYVGRVHPMKAPFDWIKIAESTLEKVGSENVAFYWLGDGPLFKEVLAYLQESKFKEGIFFLGFESDRTKLLKFLRELDVFLFCHITPESPRCLIESLLSATPIVGYTSPYAEDLISTEKAGALFDKGNIKDIVRFLEGVIDDKATLKLYTEAASKSRTIYNDTAVFLHRSNLIKEFL